MEHDYSFVDWEEQWATFAPHFEGGLSHVDLGKLGEDAAGAILQLKPGAGFGDLSHPTTRLTMALMLPLVKGNVVFDIGCGSGILSVGAALLGAKKVYGLDIESAALEHSRENAKLNRIDHKILFTKELRKNWISKAPLVIAMNMIWSEQESAWGSLGLLHGKEASIVTSGLLSSQREEYLLLTQSWGWSLVEEKEEEGWMGFVFSQKGLIDPSLAS